MPAEEARLCRRFGREPPAGEPRHHIHEEGQVVLRLAHGLDPREAKSREVLSDQRERALVEEAGEIVGGVGKKLAPTNADEECEELALDLCARRLCRRAAQIRDVLTEDPSAAREAGERIEQVLAGRTSEQDGQEVVVPRAKSVDVVHAGAAQRLRFHRSERRRHWSVLLARDRTDLALWNDNKKGSYLPQSKSPSSYWASRRRDAAGAVPDASPFRRLRARSRARASDQKRPERLAGP